VGLRDLAVVVPIGPGERAWQGLVPALAALPPEARVMMVAVSTADLPSADDASVAALRAELVPLIAARGRAHQQNAGARAAERRWLWFVHADSRLAPTTLPALARALERTPDALGYFDLRFENDGPPAVRLNALGAYVRSRVFGLPFGDQGLFVAHAVFERLGGFDPALPYGEDHAFVWAARRAGIAVVPAGAPLYTSARKYADGGWLATTARHLRLTAAQAWHEARRA
jgi:hypothetical protein